MTTITVDHNSMACDLQMTYGLGTKMKTSSKITVVEGEIARKLFDSEKVFIGFSGSAAAWAEAVTWLAMPETKPPRLRDIELLMLTSNKEIMHSMNLTSWIGIKDKYFSIGSGSPFALAAMECGKSTEEAIKIASKRDVFTGMGIKVYNM